MFINTTILDLIMSDGRSIHNNNNMIPIMCVALKLQRTTLSNKFRINYVLQ